MSYRFLEKGGVLIDLSLTMSLDEARDTMRGVVERNFNGKLSELRSERSQFFLIARAVKIIAVAADRAGVFTPAERQTLAQLRTDFEVAADMQTVRDELISEINAGTDVATILETDISEDPRWP